MSGRRRLGRLFLGVAALACALALAGLYLLRASPTPNPLTTYAFIAVALVAGTTFALWRVVDRMLLRDIAALAGEIRVVAHGAEGARVPAERFEHLRPLPETVNELVEKLAAARRDVARAVAESTLRVEEQKSRLAAVLQDLHEGVLVCNLQHQILLYNRKALGLLQVTGGLGLGRDLLQLVAREPVLHTLQRLMLQAGGDRQAATGDRAAQFLTATSDGRSLLRAQMGLMVGAEQHVTGYVLTLADATAELATLGRCDALLRDASEGLRGSVANLRTAAEVVVEHADLEPAERGTLDRAIFDECRALSERIERIGAEYRSVTGRLWPMAEIHSADLVNLVARRVAARGGCTVAMTGLPHWLRGDSHSLVILLGDLVERLCRIAAGTSFELSVEPAGTWLHLDIGWPGAPVAMAELTAWMHEPLREALGGLTIGDVLRHHGSDMWSEPAGPGRARLRVPLPGAAAPERSDVPAPRPEFFDFDLLLQPLPRGALGNTPLERLSYVAFDLETTGLSPSTGDEMIALGAVRIVNGRILTGETFEALVNPGRPIPPASIRFHGITDEMVRNRPRAEAVLPRFRTFVADAVLVAHNAAFDLTFLKLKERAAGVRFDNPVLDTLILSRRLQGDAGDHSLDGLAARLGIRVVDRHSALGDAAVTAAIFLRLIEMLKEGGIRTLDDAIRSSNMQLELHARERAF